MNALASIGDDVALLSALLDGATFANAIRRNGKPCRIRLPDDPESSTALIGDHLLGASRTLTFHADGHKPWRERVDAVALAALCPSGNGLCRWVGIDLDAYDHGSHGLVDPVHAVRAIAERADAQGLLSGLLVARSRRGRGRHVFLMLPKPAALNDAVIGVAVLVAMAFRVAASDVAECGAPHAFRCANEEIARPGDAGAVELVPRSTIKPAHGWALALPLAGAFDAHGGGQIVDPFDDKPIHHDSVPCCDPQPWKRLVSDNRHFMARMDEHKNRRHLNSVETTGSPPLHPLTREYLAGQSPKGRRNESAFAAACNLLGHGLPLCEVEQQILDGARGCELPEREARSAIRSALRAVEQSR